MDLSHNMALPRAMHHFVLLGIFFSCLAAGAPLSMDQLYKEAVERSETVAIQVSRTAQADERVSQATGAIFPSITASGSYLRQDAGSQGTIGGFGRTEQTTARITATQPLFRGLAEWATLRGARARREGEEFRTAQSKADLYRSVADAYFKVITAERDRDHVGTQLRLTRERVKELEERERIGRSRRSEVLTARSQEAAVLSQLEGAEAEVARSRYNLSLVTGLPATTEIAAPAEPGEPPKLSEFLDRVAKRPELRGLERDFDSADDAVSAARGAHFPSIDLTGNYYPYRTGALEGVKWDVTVGVSLPIFQGGTISARVGEAIERRKEAELSLIRAKRSAETDVRSTHERAERLARQVGFLRESVKVAEESYRVQTRDYRYGLVTNIEVLQALNASIEARRSLDRSIGDLGTAVASLRALVGEVPN